MQIGCPTRPETNRTPHGPKKHGVWVAVATAWLAIVGLTILASTIYGVVHFYSPVPFSDQWGGYLGFIHKLQLGQTSAWWEQHMEHRIVFSRVLFWIDANLFGGDNAFLLAIGLILQMATAALFVWQARKSRTPVPTLAVIGITSAFLFSWVQQENFTWGFQSQFLSVYLFSFAAFAAFSGNVGDRSAPWAGQAVAALLAILATLSMGNGVFGFAILFFQSVILRRSWREAVVPLVIGGIVATIYFTGYHKPGLDAPHLPLSSAIERIPLFFVVFMGCVGFAKGYSFFGAIFCGFVSLAIATYFTVMLYVKRSITPYRSFLIAGYAFVVLSGIAASLGRYPMGLAQAVVSRYDTPMYLSWVCLILLALDVCSRARWLILIAAALLATWIAPYQQGVNGSTQGLFDRDIAVLTMKIGVDRPETTGAIYPPAGRGQLLEYARYAADTKFGPYASGWLHDAGVVKFSSAQVDNTLCSGYFDTIEKDSNGPVATGWVSTKRNRSAPVLILLVDSADRTVGYGISGSSRPDVKRLMGARGDTGWKAFAARDSAPTAAYAYETGRFCKIPGVPRSGG